VRNLRVLLVEDDSSMIGLIQEAVKFVCHENKCKCEVSYQEMGSGVADLHKNEGFDLIIMDLLLPDINGMEIIRQIREFDKVVEFIIITGQPTLETAIQAISFDVWAYFMKPFVLEELVIQSRKAIENSILKSKILSLANFAEKVLR
jgi:DNA-binding NtrC family response regulator